MTLDEFIKKWEGNGIDWDGHYGDQCVDLYRQYVDEVLGFPQSPGVNGAKDIWNNYLKDYFTAIPNTPAGVPQKGDVVIWDSGQWGHVAIFLSGGASQITTLDQNYPIGSFVAKRNHNYTGIVGWLRPSGTMEPPMSEDIRIKLLDEEKIKTEGDLREVLERNRRWDQLQNDKRNADIKIDLLQDEIKKLKNDLQAERDANVARVNAEKEQSRNLLKSVAEATGSNQSLPEILQAISILRSDSDNKDKAERAEKQAKEELNSEKLRHAETADKLQNMTTLCQGTQKELKDANKALERLTVINNKNNMANKKLNPVLEALKEPLRLAVLSVIPIGITYFAGTDAIWALVATVLLKTLDKYLHKSQVLDKGLTRF